MELGKAFKVVVETEGVDVLKELRLVNILADLNAYEDVPAAKFIVRTLIGEGVTGRLLAIGEWNHAAEQLISRFILATGFMPDSVNAIVKAIAFALDWIIAPPSAKPPQAQSQPNTSQVPVGPSGLSSDPARLAKLADTAIIFKAQGKWGIDELSWGGDTCPNL